MNDVALIAIAIGFLLTATLVARTNRLIRDQNKLIGRFMEIASSGVASPSPDLPETSEWPDVALLQAGFTAPAALIGEQWNVVLLIDESCEKIAVAAKETGVSEGYQLLIASPASALASAADLQLDARWFRGVPIPSVALVDPHGVVQGVGAVHSAAEIIDFLNEGDVQGIGPRHDSHAVGHGHGHDHSVVND